jgi:hypothetical protein
MAEQPDQFLKTVDKAIKSVPKGISDEDKQAIKDVKDGKK